MFGSEIKLQQLFEAGIDNTHSCKKTGQPCVKAVRYLNRNLFLRQTPTVGKKKTIITYM